MCIICSCMAAMCRHSIQKLAKAAQRAAAQRTFCTRGHGTRLHSTCHRASALRSAMARIQFNGSYYKFIMRVHSTARYATSQVRAVYFVRSARLAPFSSRHQTDTNERTAGESRSNLPFRIRRANSTAPSGFIQQYELQIQQRCGCVKLLRQFMNKNPCSFALDIHPFAFRTHTHAMGRVVSGYFKHENQWTLIGKRNPQWPQLFQLLSGSLTIRQGDYIAAQCRFDSADKSEWTPMGQVS